jgi:isoquinoline 1-oxidoreductase beta subunit
MIHHRPQGLDHPLFQRSSLISSVAVGGDMVLSLRLPLGSGNTGLAESYTRNASIRIDRDGEVFLTMPHLRTRQDIYTSVFMLIAERLKVSVNHVYVEHPLPKEGFVANEMLDVQATGSSEAIRGALRLLGEAGATARVMLIAAAAERWDTNPRSCHAHEGEVIHTTTWRKLKYGELTIDAAYRPIPKEIELESLREEGCLERAGETVRKAETARYGVAAA